MGPRVRAWLNRWLGERGEREAVRHLRRMGLRVITRNYRTTHGEIDLIARDGDCLVFVEVKTRRRGEPAEAVTLEKQRRLTAAAVHFLKRHRLLDRVPCRFDVVAIVWPIDDLHGGEAIAKAPPPSIEHFQDAFPAIDRGWTRS
jgi:putative endonuclease